MKLSEIRFLFSSVGHYRFSHFEAIKDFPSKATYTITQVTDYNFNNM
jgi:hypothetical protein